MASTLVQGKKSRPAGCRRYKVKARVHGQVRVRVRHTGEGEEKGHSFGCTEERTDDREGGGVHTRSSVGSSTLYHEVVQRTWQRLERIRSNSNHVDRHADALPHCDGDAEDNEGYDGRDVGHRGVCLLILGAAHCNNC